MNLSELSIRRPVFITCLVILLLTVGTISLKKLPVDLFPDVTFPVIMINTSYAGASPEEVETLVSKVIEEEMNNIPGIKSLSSENTEGRSQVVAQFTEETDIKYAEQQVRDKISAAKGKLPKDITEPVIKRIDPADKPIVILALRSHLPKVALYELAEKTIKPKLEQINQVGMVETLGSSGRQIHVDLDRNKLAARGISATQVANQLANAGNNIPIGKIDQGEKEKIFRSIGEYHTVKDIGNVVVNFFGNDIPVKISDLGKISDSVADAESKTYVNGQASLIMMIFRQTGTNTIEVVDKVRQKLVQINNELQTKRIPVVVSVVRDSSKLIRANVNDVVESILIGIILTISVVYLFLGSARSTFITGLALPTSLIGAFLLMHLANFSINTMSLLALSLAVGLLVDDAIVVRENIFRHGESGKHPRQAAIDGTKEVLLAVIATSLTVMAVFGPIGFLHGIVGGFFKEFGLTVCFAMLISLFDALTIAPMLSTYIGLGRRSLNPNKLVASSHKLQIWLEHLYEKVLKQVLRYPITTLSFAFIIFITSVFAVKYVPKTFVPPQDNGEFLVTLELPPGATLSAMDNLVRKVDHRLRTNPEIATRVAIVGSKGESNRAQLFINMIPSKERAINTSDFKAKIRKQLKAFKGVKTVVKDIDLVGGGQRPFNLNITGGDNLDELKAIAFQVYNILKKNKNLLDPEISYKSGKPEMRIFPDKARMQTLGVASTAMGQELRTQIEGRNAAVFRENGQEYDIRVRLAPEQRDLQKNFSVTLVPNMNNNLIQLADIAKPVHTLAPATISRENRARYIQISGDIAPHGSGMGGVTQEINDLFKNKIKLPPGVAYAFAGQAESFKELTENMIIAVTLGILFIYLVLASLYESFITPFTIMLVLPLAACGAFYGLLITQHALDIFSMIGCILLFGIATKNSILLVDYTQQLTKQGLSREEAIIKAGITRLRPILMTTIALIAGMLPIAIGLNEASKQRTSMGIAVIGGLISSTLLTLVVVPAAYSYIERFRTWAKKLFSVRHRSQKLPSGTLLPQTEEAEQPLGLPD
jgi:hydrophobic/amphiphilic exporter-1 (mainly G- bacteria), HAE1 family